MQTLLHHADQRPKSSHISGSPLSFSKLELGGTMVTSLGEELLLKAVPFCRRGAVAKDEFEHLKPAMGYE